MALNSPIFNKVMSQVNADDSKLASIQGLMKQPQKLADVEPDITMQPDLQANPVDSSSLTSKPSQPQPQASSGDFMSKLYDVETKGGTISNRPGSQYKGIAQLGDDIRKPLLKKYGYTEAQYDGSTDSQKELSNAHINNIKSRIGEDASELDLWMSHNMGVGGKNQIKSGKVSPQVLKNLRNQKGMNDSSTPQDYINYYSKIFNQ